MQRPGEFPPIYFVPGDTVAFTVALKDSDGVAIDLTGTTVAAQVRSISGTDTDPLLATYTIANTVGVAGTVDLRLDPADSLVLKGKRNIAWDLQVTYLDDTVRTVVSGLMIPVKDVTL